MGTAMAIHLARCGQRVALWSRRDEGAAAIRRDRENRRLLPGCPLPPSVDVTADIASAAEADALLVAVPSRFLRSQLREIAGAVPSGTPVISVIKGIEVETFSRPSEVITQELGERSVCCLFGPSHAEEIAKGKPTSVVAASSDLGWAERVQRFASNDRFRVYSSDDQVGVEWAGAMKNVMGLAAGIVDGIGYGDNAKAALLTRAILEMQRFGEVFGADPRTFIGLAGVGDLITTCTSEHGRNLAVGRRLGQGETLEAILQSMNGQVAEGIPTTAAIFAMLAARDADAARSDLPIVAETHAVLFDGKSPRDACDSLMRRPLKAE